MTIKDKLYLIRLKLVSSSFLQRREVVGIIFVFVMVLSIPLVVSQINKPQEIRTKAQVLPNCQSLTYPCQEGLISFPNDEGKHDKQIEWWYVNFNTTSTSLGIPLSGAVALVRVKQSIGEDKGYALLEMTNENNQSGFFYRILTGTITSQVNYQNINFVADPGSEVNNIKFYQDTNPFRYRLEVTGTGINIDLVFTSNKRPLIEGGTGYVPIFANYPSDSTYYSGYYSLTNLSAVTNGSVVLPGVSPFTGSGIGWIDHQWFNSPFSAASIANYSAFKANHEWFSLQLDNNVQIVAWNIFREPSSLSLVLKNLDIIDSFGNQTHHDNLTVDPKSYWKTPDGRVFAGSWRLFKEGEFDLTINPTIQNQYVAPATTYEGSTNVSGNYKGLNVAGQGFAEMTLTYFNQPCDRLIELCEGSDNDCDYRIDEFCPPPTPTPTPTPAPDTSPPVVTINYPANGSSVLRNTTVNITALASDNVGIAKVEFYVRGTLTCTDLTSPYNCSWKVPAKPRVIYTLQVNAYDTAGNTASSSIQVTAK